MSLTENDIKRIRAKKYINTNEFAELYSMCKNSQANYRGRLYDPLPCHQKVFRGKILYDVEEIELWLKNQYK